MLEKCRRISRLEYRELCFKKNTSAMNFSHKKTLGDVAKEEKLMDCMPNIQ